MNRKYKIRIGSEESPRSVGVTEIMLAEKLFEINDFISCKENPIETAEKKSYMVAKALGKRLSIDDREKVAVIEKGSIFLQEIH